MHDLKLLHKILSLSSAVLCAVLATFMQLNVAYSSSLNQNQCGSLRTAVSDATYVQVLINRHGINEERISVELKNEIRSRCSQMLGSYEQLVRGSIVAGSDSLTSINCNSLSSIHSAGPGIWASAQQAKVNECLAFNDVGNDDVDHTSVSCDPTDEDCNSAPAPSVVNANLDPPGTQLASTNVCSDTSGSTYANLKEQLEVKCDDIIEEAGDCCGPHATACGLNTYEKGRRATIATDIGVQLLQVFAGSAAGGSIIGSCQSQEEQAIFAAGIITASERACAGRIDKCETTCTEIKRQVTALEKSCNDEVAHAHNTWPTDTPDRASKIAQLERGRDQVKRLLAEADNGVEACNGYEKQRSQLAGQVAQAGVSTLLASQCQQAASTGFVEASVPVVTPLPVVTQLPSVGDGIGETAGAPELSVGNSTGSLSETSIDDLLNDFDEDNFANNDGAGPSGFGAASTGGGGGGGGGVPSTGSLGGGGGPGGSDGGYAPDDKVGSSLAGASGGGGYSSSSGGGYANIGGGSSSYGSGSSKYRKKSAKFDLKKYLPGNKKDPKKAKRGLASKGEISLNVHSSIWDTISTTYKNELGNL